MTCLYLTVVCFCISQDGLVCIGYAVFWGIAAIVNTAFAAIFSNGVLGAAAVSTLVYM